MDNWEREFSLCEILAESFVGAVGGGEKVEVIVADLEECAEEGD